MLNAVFITPLALSSPPPEFSRVKNPTATNPETEDFVFAGVTNLDYISPRNLVGELGINIFPFARGGITATHTIALMMRYTLNLPSEGGLGLRRLQWRTVAANGPSMGLSRKMGFESEGITRYEMLVWEGRNWNGHGTPIGVLGWRSALMLVSIDGREGDGAWGKKSADTVNKSVTCEDWERRVKQLVQEVLQ